MSEALTIPEPLDRARWRAGGQTLQRIALSESSMTDRRDGPRAMAWVLLAVLVTAGLVWWLA